MLLLHFCRNISFNLVFAALTSQRLLGKLWLYHIPEKPNEHNNILTYSIHLHLILFSLDKANIILYIIVDSLCVGQFTISLDQNEVIRV